MKSLLLSLISLMLYSNIAFSETVFSSRNMPMTCDYVFSVESDLRLELPLNSEDETISYQLQNSWKPYNWTPAILLPLKSNSSARFAEWSLQSMSIPLNFLYRKVKITFPKSHLICSAEFGREFGEPCMPEGRSSTPWRARVLNCETFEN